MNIIDTLRATTRPLTIAQVSEVLGIHPQTAYRWVDAGRLPVIRIGSRIRFDPSRIADWLEARTVS
jgi:excisionase family DNA binding protein